MARLLIGLPKLEGKIANYAKRYDLVEVTPLDDPLPKPSKLASWREQVPPAFVFNVVLPSVVATLSTGDELDDALGKSIEVARTLMASCIVLATPPSIRPTPRNRERIAKLAERMPKQGHVLVWHASGLWEPDDYMKTAYAAGWLPAFDAAQEPLPPGPVVYTRIRGFGRATELGHERIAHAARQLAGRRDAYVVVDRAIAGRVRSGLAAAMAKTERKVPSLFKPESMTDDGSPGTDEEQ
jgi:uncharacterized protein YecE (DUF72 family)